MTSLTLISHSQKVIITSGIIPVYRQMIRYTISDLNKAEELFGDLSPSETDKKAFQRMCVKSWNSSNSLQPRTIEVVRETLGIGTTQPSEMVFCTPEEAFANPLMWERYLDVCSYSFKEKFKSAVESLQDTSSSGDTIKHFFEHLERRNNQQRFIVIGQDLTKPYQILDL